MITDYAQMTVKLSTLLNNEEAKQAIEMAMSTYPIYKGETITPLLPTREQLNEKILNHYKYREIGFETVGRFLDELKITMCEIMPYYNELFKTVEIMLNIDDPFGNVDVTETFEETREENVSSEGQTSSTSNSSNSTEASSNSTSNGVSKFSDTPQNSVNNIDNYMTEYREQSDTASGQSNESASSEVEGTATSEGQSQTTGTTRHTFTKKGNQGVNTYAHDMNEFRTSIIDVVDRIIHDNRIAELFMLVW